MLLSAQRVNGLLAKRSVVIESELGIWAENASGLQSAEPLEALKVTYRLQK